MKCFTLQLTGNETVPWKCTIDDLPLKDNNGQLYSYRVEEFGVTDGSCADHSVFYTVQYASSDGTTWKDTCDGVELNADSSASLSILNTLKPTYVLPETGGTGTHWYTGVGALLTGTALVLLYRSKKRKRRAGV